MTDEKKTFSEKAYKNYMTFGVLNYQISPMEMIKKRLKNASDTDTAKEKNIEQSEENKDLE